VFRRKKRQLPADAQRILAAHVGDWAGFTAVERERLLHLTAEFLPSCRWEAARGFELTDEMCTVIAAQVALVCLGFEEEGLAPVAEVTTIIVHPRTIVLDGTHHEGGGIMYDGERTLSGEAHDDHGPLLLAWDAVRRETRYRRGRRNVVIHEVAHKLDMLDGVIDGTPPHADPDALRRWTTVSDRVYRAMQREADPVLDDYGATAPSEFFAVVSEQFFTGPLALQEAHPDLYDCYREFYRQHPAARRQRALQV